MSRITRDNYELFFLDYADGNLDGTTIKEVIDFISKNPDLKPEFENIKTPYNLKNNTVIPFSKKESLKVKLPDFTGKIDLSNYGYFMAASVEGDLDKNKTQEFDDFCNKFPQLKSETLIFKKLRLNPDKSVHYYKKDTLYKEKHISFINKRLYYLISAAASIIIIISLLFMKGRNIEIISNKIAASVNIQNSSNIQTINIKEKPDPFAQEFIVTKSRKISDDTVNPVQTKNEVADNFKVIDQINAINSIYVNSLPNKIPVANPQLNLACLPPINNEKKIIKYNGIPNPFNLLRDKAIKPAVDNNKDDKVSYWEVLTAASKTINKISGDRLFEIDFTPDGELTELALKNDYIKISRSNKN